MKPPDQMPDNKEQAIAHLQSRITHAGVILPVFNIIGIIQVWLLIVSIINSRMLGVLLGVVFVIWTSKQAIKMQNIRDRYITLLEECNEHKRS